MDELRKLVEKLQQPQSLSMYAGPNHMALALLEERAEILAALAAIPAGGWRPIEEAPIADFDTTHPLDCLVWSQSIGGVRLGHVWRYVDGEPCGQAAGYNGEWGITHFCNLPSPPLPANSGGNA